MVVSLQHNFTHAVICRTNMITGLFCGLILLCSVASCRRISDTAKEISYLKDFIGPGIPKDDFEKRLPFYPYRYKDMYYKSGSQKKQIGLHDMNEAKTIESALNGKSKIPWYRRNIPWFQLKKETTGASWPPDLHDTISLYLDSIEKDKEDSTDNALQPGLHR